MQNPIISFLHLLFNWTELTKMFEKLHFLLNFVEFRDIIMHILTPLWGDFERGYLFMTLNRKMPRETRKVLFKDEQHRDAAFTALEMQYPDVHIQKVMGNAILVNLTDSKIYDLQVSKSVEILGGSWMPRTA